MRARRTSEGNNRQTRNGEIFIAKREFGQIVRVRGNRMKTIGVFSFRGGGGARFECSR